MAGKGLGSHGKQSRYAPYTKTRLDRADVFQRENESTIATSSTEVSESDSVNPLPCVEEGNTQVVPEDVTIKTYPCISVRQPYAGFILNGLKTLETRWTPVFQEAEGRTVAIHAAWKDWEGGDEWRTILQSDHDDEEIEDLLKDGERHGRAAVAGLVDVGETWHCPVDAQSEKTQEWEKSALLRPLNEKYLTKLSNPRWLKKVVRTRGQRGIWEVEIPKDCH